jgi:hypothetical protein
MENKLALNNKDEFPSEEVISCHLGEANIAWDAFIDMLEKDFPEISHKWRYYNDGKSWLCKVTKKKKTVCWVGVFDKHFKTTFYFTDKAADLITASTLSEKYKDQFKDGKYYGKIKGISIEIKNPSDLEDTKILIGIKEQLK